MKKLILITLSFLFVASAHADDVPLKWLPSDGAVGYKVYKFEMPLCGEPQTTWDAGIDVGNVTEYVYTGVPSTGLVLFRVGAYNNNSESIMLWSGAWYNGDEKPLDVPYGAGVQSGMSQSMADKVEAIILQRQKQ